MEGGVRAVPLVRRLRDGVGVVSEAAKREAGGVAKAVGVVDRRRRLWREAAASAGEEKVLPIGLEMESSGEEGPVGIEIGKNQKQTELGKLGLTSNSREIEREVTVVERVGGHGWRERG